MLDAIPGVAQAKGLWAVAKGWVILGALLSVFAFGGFVGHRWAKGDVESAKRARDNQAQVAKQWKDRSAGYEAIVARFQATEAANAKTAKTQKDEAERILAGLREQKQEAERAKAKWIADYEKAKRNPNCAEMLKETTCSVFRSY